MPAPAPPEFERYLGGFHVLIVDPTASTRSNLCKTIVALGAETRRVKMVRTFEQARDLIAEFRPHLVVAEFHLGKRSGLELAHLQREARSNDPDAIFILVTGKATETAVALAAEEEVDSFIVKPFTRASVEESFRRVFESRSKPSEYLATLARGKSAMRAADFTEAEAQFVRATAQSGSPVLAYVHLAETKVAQGKLEAAEAFYRAGLILSPNHYKCNLGLYDLYLRQKKLEDAYLVMNGLTTVFPATPARLAEALRLAVSTGRFEDVDRLFDRFQDMDERDENVTVHVCAALVVAAKHALAGGPKKLERALALLADAAIVAGGRSTLLRSVIVTLADAGQTERALAALKRFPEDAQRGADYRISTFLVFAAEGAIESAVREGRALIRDGLADSDVYAAMIECYLKLRKLMPAQELAYEALRVFGESERFRELLRRAGSVAP